ncbi:MAG: PAS domain S-box protein [Phycisphaerales bacterium]|nr:PAS domain S-box protein [Phycisphaerales bacterium]
MRGESATATAGLLLAVLFLCTLVACAWWAARTHQRAQEATRATEIESVGALLTAMSESLLATGETGTLRRLVADAALRHKFARCRLVLPDGSVAAAESASQITLASLPEQWSDMTGPLPPPVMPPDCTLHSFPVSVPGRGTARLDLIVPTRSLGWSSLDTLAGVGIIGAVALLALLLVYRYLRHRIRALTFIGEALLALDAGEKDVAALTVQEALGPEAAAWNELLAERAGFQQVLVTKRLLELPAARDERSRDLTSMCDAMPQGLVLVDGNLHITYANGAAALYLGSARDGILGGDIAACLKHAEVLDSVKSVASGTLRRSSSAEISQTQGDTTTVLRFTVRPVRHDDESAAMLVIEDVTQQRLADDSRNTFVAKVTHELRTPLTNILLYAETAMDDSAQAPTRTQALNVINQEAKRLDRIVNDMLSVSELEAGAHDLRLDDLSLATLFEELQLDYEAAAQEKNLKLSFDLPPKLPTITADRDKVTLAIHNLLGNALKYTPAGGTITVAVVADDRQLEVRVTDSGIGIAPNDAEKVFEKFYRAQDERLADITGSGLGLALAREVIRLHGGDIALESELDRGSTFTLTVPVMARARAA